MALEYENECISRRCDPEEQIEKDKVGSVKERQLEFRHDPRLLEDPLRRRMTELYYKYKSELSTVSDILKYCRDSKTTDMIPGIIDKIIAGMFPVISACAEPPETVRVNKISEYVRTSLSVFPHQEMRLHLALVASVFSVYDYLKNSNIGAISYLSTRIPDVYIYLVKEEVCYNENIPAWLLPPAQEIEVTKLPESPAEYFNSLGSLEKYAKDCTLNISKSTLYRMAKNECTGNWRSRTNRVEVMQETCGIQ